MSMKDSRILIAAYTVDFSVTNLTTSYTSALTFTTGGTTLGANTKGVYIENTSGAPIAIATGASASPQIVDVSPINNNVEKSLILNKGHSLYLKTLGTATLTSGKFTICFYN